MSSTPAPTSPPRKGRKTIKWAWFCAAVGFCFSIGTILINYQGVGDRPATIEKTNIVAPFNVSFLGLAEYHDPNSALGQDIRALVPVNHTLPSLTQYLGIKDWYSMGYFSVCSGLYVPMTKDPSRLSSSTFATTCYKQRIGYTFSLESIIREQLRPTVKTLADQISARAKDYNTKLPIVLWIVGGVAAFIDIVLLPRTLMGMRRINMYTSAIAMVSFVALFISACLAVNHDLAIRRGGIGHYSGGMLGATWTAVVAMFITWILACLEWQFEIWTPDGTPITIYGRPYGASWIGIEPMRWKLRWDAWRGVL